MNLFSRRVLYSFCSSFFAVSCSLFKLGIFTWELRFRFSFFLFSFRMSHFKRIIPTVSFYSFTFIYFLFVYMDVPAMYSQIFCGNADIYLMVWVYVFFSLLLFYEEWHWFSFYFILTLRFTYVCVGIHVDVVESLMAMGQYYCVRYVLCINMALHDWHDMSFWNYLGNYIVRCKRYFYLFVNSLSREFSNCFWRYIDK